MGHAPSPASFQPPAGLSPAELATVGHCCPPAWSRRSCVSPGMGAAAELGGLGLKGGGNRELA